MRRYNPSQTSSQRSLPASLRCRRTSLATCRSRTIMVMGRFPATSRVGLLAGRAVGRDDARQFEVLTAGALEHLVLGLGGLREAVDLDEALGGRGVVLVA